MVVDNVLFEGNIKTKDVILSQELPYRPGDTVTTEDLEAGTQAIKDLGLFESVELSTAQTEGDTVTVTYKVVEKRFNFILPKLNRNGDGDITTGIVWRSDNLFGLNQTSKFTIAYKKFDDSDEEDEEEIKWEYLFPRIPNTPYSMSMTLVGENTNLEETVDGETGVYDRERRLARVLVGRWLTQSGPSQGLNIRVGPLFESYEHEFVSGTDGLLPDIENYGLNIRLDGYYVHDRLLSREGMHFGYNVVISDELFGSDLNYLEHHAFYRRYMPIGNIDHQNLNFQIRLGLIDEPLLGPPEFKIGGSTRLRGYDRDAVEGNSFFVVNIEYLRPIFNRETLRAAAFVDFGNAWEDRDDISFSDTKVGAGIGLRWKLKRFVRTDVRLDIAQGLSDGGETKAYLGTRSTF